MTVELEEVHSRLGKIESMLEGFSPTKKDAPEVESSNIIKQFNPSKMEVVEPLYIAGTSIDAHGDAYKDPVEGPKKLVAAIKAGREAKALQFSLFHKHKTKGFEIVDEWVNETESTLEDGTVVPANMPLGLIKFSNEALYNMRVEGRIGGLSMGAKGLVETVGEDVYKGLLEDLDMSETPRRLISDFILTHKAAHYAYTSWSQGGAASKQNEPISIMKSTVSLAEDEQLILKDIDEEYMELDKAKKLTSDSTVEPAPSTPIQGAQDAGVDNQTINKGHDMSVEQDPKYLELEKKFKAMEIKEDLLPFNLEKSVATDIATAMADLTVEGCQAIVKGFEAIVAEAKTQVDALTLEKEDLTKSLATSSPEGNPLLDELNKELGEGTPVVHTSAPKSLAARAAEKFNSKNSK